MYGGNRTGTLCPNRRGRLGGPDNPLGWFCCRRVDESRRCAFGDKPQHLESLDWVVTSALLVGVATVGVAAVVIARWIVPALRLWAFAVQNLPAGLGNNPNTGPAPRASWPPDVLARFVAQGLDKLLAFQVDHTRRG